MVLKSNPTKTHTRKATRNPKNHPEWLMTVKEGVLWLVWGSVTRWQNAKPSSWRKTKSYVTSTTVQRLMWTLVRMNQLPHWQVGTICHLSRIAHGFMYEVTKTIYWCILIHSLTHSASSVKFNWAAPTVGASCTTSSPRNGYPCDKTYDGDSSYTSTWSTNTFASGQWLKIMFTKEYNVRAVGLYNRCTNATQCSSVDVIFSDNAKFTVGVPQTWLPRLLFNIYLVFCTRLHIYITWPDVP